MKKYSVEDIDFSYRDSNFPANEILINDLFKCKRGNKNIIDDNYIPNKIFAGSKNTKSELNILQKKYIKNKTYIYVCVDNVCLLPVTTTAEAVPLITF